MIKIGDRVADNDFAIVIIYQIKIYKYFTKYFIHFDDGYYIVVRDLD